MAREVYSRLLLSGTLVARSPLHVGGYGNDVDTDMPLARDGAGHFYVPGTGISGALRNLVENRFGLDLTNEFWGFQDSGGGFASHVLVEDSEIGNPDSLVMEIRDHVGIDRETGSAAEGIKYDRAILPRGTRLSLHLAVEVPSRESRKRALAMLSGIRSALEKGEVRLGAAKSRGLGSIGLMDGNLTEVVLGTRDGILAFLGSGSGMPVPESDIQESGNQYPPKPRRRLGISLTWEPAGPLMVKAGAEGVISDMVPLVTGTNGGVSLVLPGSSVKGALRNHAERIVRTLLDQEKPAWVGNQRPQRFMDALKLPLVNELFGATAEKVNKGDVATSLPGLGAFRVEDCLGTKTISQDQWQAIQNAVDDQSLLRALSHAGLESWSQAYHVAIDRWLGSAAESMLYTVLEPRQTEWEPISMELDLLRLGDKTRLPAVALALLFLRDLASKRIPLGFATNRGMGTIRINDIAFSTDEPSLQGLEKVFTNFCMGTDLETAGIPDQPRGLWDNIQKAWSQWIELETETAKP